MSESKNRDDGESNKVSIAISASRSPITQAGSISPVIAPPATRMFPPHRSPWSNAGGGCAGSSVPTESASDSTRRPSAGGRYGRWQRNRRSAQKQIGRAHVRTTDKNAHHGWRLLLRNKKH